ncbi:MAG: sugar ABC transporter permease [Clostridia bacterium]|nr:sugar ABC transporter permease [Clostridia bacterium]
MKIKKLTLTQKSNMVGYGFISIWLIGIIFFFVIPVFHTLIYSFSQVTVSKTGMKTAWVGLQNFNKALFVDPNFVRNLTNSIVSMIGQVPVLVLFSMFIAVVLNQKFRGRGAARVLFFLPVIIASGISIQILSANGMSTDVSGKETMFMFKASIFPEEMSTSSVMMYLQTLVNQIFNICWKSGIQILLFLSGLQTIPQSYYEVSSLEGATAWEEFWKITFPLLSPFSLLCVVYTIIDSFTDSANPVMTLIKTAFDGFDYGFSSAMSWIYFIVILIVILLVQKIVFRNVIYMED